LKPRFLYFEILNVFVKNEFPFFFELFLI
jgi:hypothetical protein